MIKSSISSEESSSILKKIFLRLYHSLADVRLFLTSIPVVILFMIIFTLFELQIDPNGPGAITAFQLAFSSHRAHELLNQWGYNGVNIFRISLFIDMIFPITYVLLLSSGIAYFSKNSVNGNDVSSRVLFVFSLPFIAALFDWAENFLQLVMITDTTFISDASAMLVGMYALLKFLFLGIAAIYLLYLIVVARGKRKDIEDQH